MARSYQGAEWPDRSKYVSRTEAARTLGIGPERILPMIKRGELEGLQRASWWYVSRKSLAAYQKRRGF